MPENRAPHNYTAKKSDSSYSDIIDQPRPMTNRRRMTREARAAQFAAFAALTGFDDVIERENDTSPL